MIVVDITSKANRVHDFDHAGVNEHAADNQSYDAIKNTAQGEVHLLQKKQRSNVQHPTPNARISSLRWTLRVGRLVHLVLSHSSQPPSRTNTQFFPWLSFSCASSRSRRATSADALQLCALQ